MANEIRQDERGLWAEQDKDAFLDYSLDWSEVATGDDVITSSTWAAEGLVASSSNYSGKTTSVWIQGGEAGRWYALTNTIQTQDGRRDQRTIRVFITDEALATVAGTALFPNMAKAVDEMRRDRLMMLAASLLPDVNVSNEFLQQKLRAAEKDAERRLRIFFEPVTVFAYEPTQAEIDALNGARYLEESAYDYEPGLWNAEDWGYLPLRQTPVIKIDSCVFAYPAPMQGFFTVPPDWMRLDKKAGHIRFVPTGNALSVGPLSSFVLSAMGGGRLIPGMIRFKYRAGLSNTAANHPDLVDLVQRMASLRIVQDAFIPGSGSISADGLSQSLSVTMKDYSDGADAALDALAQSFHGIRMTIL